MMMFDHFLQVSDVTFEDMVLGEQEAASMPWAIKFKISSGLIRNVSFRNIRIGKVGDTPWMYPQDTAAAFMIDFFIFHYLSSFTAKRTKRYRLPTGRLAGRLGRGPL